MQTEVDAIMERRAGHHARPDHAQDARGEKVRACLCLTLCLCGRVGVEGREVCKGGDCLRCRRRWTP